MKLIDGLGQLGDALSKLDDGTDWIVYHTWDTVDLTDVEKQDEEFSKFKKFVDDNKDKKICLISTTYDKDTIYLYNKIKAESYLIETVKDFKIIRLPHFIGKGLFKAFRDGGEPWDSNAVDVISLEDACKEVINFINSDDKFRHIWGEMVTKPMLYSLIQYGVNK